MSAIVPTPTVYDQRVSAAQAQLAAAKGKAKPDQFAIDTASYQVSVAQLVQTLHNNRAARVPTDPAYVTYQSARAALLAAWKASYPTAPEPSV